jgi:hypothetical protein
MMRARNTEAGAPIGWVREIVLDCPFCLVVR